MWSGVRRFRDVSEVVMPPTIFTARTVMACMERLPVVGGTGISERLEKSAMLAFVSTCSNRCVLHAPLIIAALEHPPLNANGARL